MSYIVCLKKVLRKNRKTVENMSLGHFKRLQSMPQQDTILQNTQVEEVCLSNTTHYAEIVEDIDNKYNTRKQ